MTDSVIMFNLDALNERISGGVLPEEIVTMTTWASALVEPGSNIVAEVYGVLDRPAKTRDGNPYGIDFDENNRFLLKDDDFHHQYREKGGDFENVAKLVHIGRSIYVFPEINDYGVDDKFMSVLLVNG